MNKQIPINLKEPIGSMQTQTQEAKEYLETLFFSGKFSGKDLDVLKYEIKALGQQVAIEGVRY
jgi:hypothetical protein